MLSCDLPKFIEIRNSRKLHVLLNSAIWMLSNIVLPSKQGRLVVVRLFSQDLHQQWAAWILEQCLYYGLYTQIYEKSEARNSMMTDNGIYNNIM